MEPPDHSSSTHLRRTPFVSVHHIKRKHSNLEPLRHPHRKRVVWHHSELSAGWELQTAAVLDLARQIQFSLLVKPSTKSMRRLAHSFRAFCERMGDRNCEHHGDFPLNNCAT